MGIQSKKLLPAHLLLVIFIASSGCMSRRETKELNSLENPPAIPQHNHTRAEMRAAPHDAIQPWFVGLAVSGGGSRAANFTAGCFFALQDAGIMQHVSYISSVSGGSVASAYYCVSPEWDYPTVQDRLTHKFQTDVLMGTLIAPWTWGNFFGNWNRSDVLAASFERVLFFDPDHRSRALTFDDLRPDRPRLLLNATDLQSGHRFIFTNRSFDSINSRLARYPIANAVAASAAFPVGLAPVPLRDHTSSDKLKRYIHLVDGAVADNSGLETLGQTYMDQIEAHPELYPQGAILIAIDSGTEYTADLSHQSDIGFFESLNMNLDLGVTQLLERALDATISDLVLRGAPNDASAEDLLKRLDQFHTQGHAEFHDRRHKPIYLVRLALKDVRHLDNLPTPGFGLKVSTVPTSFNIDNDLASDLYVAAKRLTTSKTWLAPTLYDLSEKLKTPSTQP